MTLSLRARILLTLFPLLALLAGLGGTAVVLIQRLGGRIDDILRENYDSVIYMERLKESLERIDSSYTFALLGEETKGRKQYLLQWKNYENNLQAEQNNITIPGERELVERLTALTTQYHQRGDAFFARTPKDPARRRDYFERGGLEDTFKEIKDTADRILNLNQDQMKQASREAHKVAEDSLAGFAVGLALASALGVWLAWRTVQGILQPIRAVIQSAIGIRAGNLDQVVPVTTQDELGLLAKEFNAMARQLRQYRQTDYARLLRTQRTSQATIDAFPDPVLVIDPEGRVEMANPAAQRLFGVASKPDEDASASVWSPPEALREPLQESLLTQRPYLPEAFEHAVLLRMEERDHSFLPHILPIRDPWGYTLGAALLLQDVTRFRWLDQVKSDLVATASHELKTPLTSLRLALHLLLEEAVGALTPKQTELLLDARENAERLLAVVNHLLDLARFEQGSEHLHVQTVAPAELLQTVAETARPRAEDKGVALTIEAEADLPALNGDAERLGHALANLLDNALQATERGGRITLAAHAEGEHVALSVRDTGLGIPPEYLPHLFDRFFRVPGQARAAGTGLGLAIVREIITAHGGSVSCTSTPGQGTTFSIRLPCESPRHAAHV